jgi:hypothetical protein
MFDNSMLARFTSRIKLPCKTKTINMKIVEARIRDLMYPTFFFYWHNFAKKEMKTQKCKNEVLFQSEKKEKNSQISTFGFQYVGRKGD